MIQHTAATPPRSHVRTLCMAWLVTLLATAGASGQCQYEVTAIIQGPPCLGGGFAPLVGRGMNSHGHVVGSWNHCNGSNDEAFYWTPETGLVTMTRPPGVHSATASDINDAGQVIGRHLFVGVAWKGFVYDIKTQQYTYLEPKYGTGVVTLNAINNAGIAVGSRSIGKPGANPNPSNAVIWNTTTGEITDLGVMKGPNSEARAINLTGSVSGLTGPVTESRAFVAHAIDYANPTILPPLPQGMTSFVNDINDLGALAGGGFMDSQQVPDVQGQPAMWNDGWIGLGWLPGAHAGGARAINNLMQIGGSCTGTSTGQQAFLWQGGNMLNLNELLSSNELTLYRVFALNDSGLILCDAGAKAAVLTPIDRPLTDLNADCRTDVHDLLILLDAWGPLPRAKQSTGLPADLNGDGVVNVSDLLILLTHWTYEGR